MISNNSKRPTPQENSGSGPSLGEPGAEPPVPIAAGLELRPYQQADVEKLRAAFAAGARKVLFCLPTGAGKTIVFTHLVARILAKAAARGQTRRIIILVHRRELVGQAAIKLDEAGQRHGIIAAGLDRDHDAPVLVVSVATAVRRLALLPPASFVVVDEAHHAIARTWRRVLDHWQDALVLGVTATPARLDGKGLGVSQGGLFDALVSGASVSQLQEAGWLAKTRAFLPDVTIDVGGLRTLAGDWDVDELARRAGQVTGDAVKEYRERATHPTAIAYGCTVAHAELIASRFRDAGYRAACVHGDMPAPLRDTLIRGLGNGSLDVLSSCDLISEGLDVPNIGNVLLLRPTQSLVLHLQQIGRGMRPAPGKDALMIFDFADNNRRHGFVEEDRLWSLAGIVKKPQTGGGGSDGPGGKRQTPAEALGTLIEFDPSSLAHLVRLPYRTFLAAQRSPAELAAYARAHGYSPKWVWHRLREQQKSQTEQGQTEADFDERVGPAEPEDFDFDGNPGTPGNPGTNEDGGAE